MLGATGSGKSIFLQSLVAQAIRDEMQLLLSDLDQTTFGMFESHPSLAAPLAVTPQDTLGLIERAISECDARAELFKALPERPQKLADYNALAAKSAYQANWLNANVGSQITQKLATRGYSLSLMIVTSG